MNLEAKPYAAELAEAWNKTLGLTRNGTFLHCRAFMDYHRERFTDASLLFVDDAGRVVGLLPANAESKRQRIASHGGLTYGGLLLTRRAGAMAAGEMLRAAATYYTRMGFEVMDYRPVPHIYHTYPAEDDLYWLMRAGAELTGRGLSSCIFRAEAIGLTASRSGGVSKAKRSGLTVDESTAWLDEFWSLLTDVLQSRHGVSPVHSLEEMKQLMAAFPENIRLYCVHPTEGSRLLGGCLMFLTERVAHVQYIAASEEGRAAGALDLLFSQLIASEALPQPYFEFGVSTEQGGHVLNEGLLFQKEGFGGRAICYDTYRVDLRQLMKI